jgi:CRP/FNR family transcriptional regulator
MKAIMENEELVSLFKDNFPFWDSLSQIEKETFVNSSQYISFPKGTNIHNGNECTGIILIRTGCLRLYILSDEGKEITLYRLFPGEMCMLSASCVLNNITFDVFVDAEENAECIIVGGCAYAALAERNTSAKIFALETALARFSDVMWVMQQILFMSMDKRLAIFLLDEVSKTGGDTVHLTHEQIAKYMGSAREVVTRMLKYFSSEGIVELSRGGIKIINKKRLRELTI